MGNTKILVVTPYIVSQELWTKTFHGEWILHMLKNTSNLKLFLDELKSGGKWVSKCSILHVQFYFIEAPLQFWAIGTGALHVLCVRRIHSGLDSCDHKCYIQVGPDNHDIPCGSYTWHDLEKAHGSAHIWRLWFAPLHYYILYRHLWKCPILPWWHLELCHLPWNILDSAFS